MTSTFHTEPEPPVPGDRTVRHEEFVRVATRLFNEHGYANTSMHDLAEALGLLKGSLYHYVKSKDELLYTIVRDHHNDFVRDVVIPSGQCQSTLAQFVEWITYHTIFICEHHERARVFMEDFRSLSYERRAEILQSRREVEESFRRMLEAGVREGWVSVGVEAEFLARSILTTINYSFVWFRPDKWSARTFADNHVELILAMIKR